MSDDILRALGRIEGQLQGVHSRLDEHSGKLDKIDERVKNVEHKAATNGLVSGGIAGVGMSLLAAKLKSMTGV